MGVLKREITIKIRELKNDLLPKEILDGSTIRLSSTYGKGTQTPHMGIELEEQRRLLPKFLSVDPEDRMFVDKVRDFWRDITLKIPPIVGYVLDTSIYTDDNGVPIEPVEPVNPQDYVHYLWATTHPLVADNLEELQADPTKKYYLHRKEDILKSELAEAEKMKLAYRELIMLTDEKRGDEAKMDWVLGMCGIFGYEGMTRKEKEATLHQIVNESPAKFIKAVSDENLELKAFIISATNRGIISKDGPTYFYADTIIGNGLDGAVRFFKNDANSQVINFIRSRAKDETTVAVLS